MYRCSECNSTLRLYDRFTGSCSHCGNSISAEQIWDLVRISERVENPDWVRPARADLSESESSYRSSLRAPARGLWSGVLDYDSAWDMFSHAIRIGIEQAWNEGAKAGGILPDELTEDEITERQKIIFNQYNHLDRLLGWIEDNSQAKGGLLSNVYARIDYWVQAWTSTYNRAEAMANGNKKKMWVYGDTEHCDTCKSLHGKVKRLSFWLAHVMPRDPPNDKLKCKGWKCQCELVDTDDPVSRGPLPGGL